MIPELLLFLGEAAATAAVGVWALRRECRAAVVTADEFAGRLAIHPARGLPAGSGRIVAGEHLTGLAAEPAPVVEVCITSVTAPTSAGVRRELDSRPQCQGTLTIHRGGTSSCHGGELDCWGADGAYSHRARVDCTELGHGCGTCSVVAGGAS